MEIRVIPEGLVVRTVFACERFCQRFGGTGLGVEGAVRLTAALMNGGGSVSFGNGEIRRIDILKSPHQSLTIRVYDFSDGHGHNGPLTVALETAIKSATGGEWSTVLGKS